jgi:hypothetical protein
MSPTKLVFCCPLNLPAAVVTAKQPLEVIIQQMFIHSFPV